MKDLYHLDIKEKQRDARIIKEQKDTDSLTKFRDAIDHKETEKTIENKTNAQLSALTFPNANQYSNTLLGKYEKSGDDISKSGLK